MPRINPDREQAVRDLADHHTRFWEPRMQGLFEALDGSAGLPSPLVLAVTGPMKRPARNGGGFIRTPQTLAMATARVLR